MPKHTEYKAVIDPEGTTCRLVKKRKPRPWNARAVGRVYCEALLSGVSQSEMREEMKKCGGESECDCELLRETIQQQLDVMTAIEIFLALLAGLKATVAVAKRAKDISLKEAKDIELSEEAARDVEKIKKILFPAKEKIEVVSEVAFKQRPIVIKE